MKCKFCFLFLFSFLFSHAQTDYYPGSAWQVKKPEELNMDKTLLDSAVRLAMANENKFDKDLRAAILKTFGHEPGFNIIGPVKPRGGPAGLVIKNGYIVTQWGDVNRVDMTFSVTKSFLSATAGLAFDAHLIGNVHEKVEGYVWDGTFKGTHNVKITWEHLLTQTSDWSGTLFGLHDWADRPPKEGQVIDWKNRKLNEPGSVFKYNDVRVNILAYSLTRVWRKPLPIVLKEKIMDPIGASNTWKWYGYYHSFVNIDGKKVLSVSGGGHHGGGLFINTADMARFGLLFLREGKWKDQQLLSAEWVHAVHQPSAVNKDYGYLWWINTSQKWKAVSQEVYYAAGAGGNYIVIDKENDLVMVLRWIDDSKMSDFMNLVLRSATAGSN